MGFHPIRRLRKRLFGTRYAWVKSTHGEIRLLRIHTDPWGRLYVHYWGAELGQETLLEDGKVKGWTSWQWKEAFLTPEEEKAAAVLDGLES